MFERRGLFDIIYIDVVYFAYICLLIHVSCICFLIFCVVYLFLYVYIYIYVSLSVAFLFSTNQDQRIGSSSTCREVGSTRYFCPDPNPPNPNPNHSLNHNHHPEPYTLYPIPCTLYPIPYKASPCAPRTLHPAPPMVIVACSQRSRVVCFVVVFFCFFFVFLVSLVCRNGYRPGTT